MSELAFDDRVRLLWRTKLDTREIADRLRVPEYMAFNSLFGPRIQNPFGDPLPGRSAIDQRGGCL